MAVASAPTLRWLLLLVAAIALAATACTDEPRPAQTPPSETPRAGESPAPSPEPSPAVSPTPAAARSHAWVAVEGERHVVLVDARSREVLATFDVPGRPHNLTVARDGTVATALQAAGTIALIRDGEVHAVELGGSPHDVKPWGDDAIVVANEGAGRVELVSVTGERLGQIPLKASPHDLTVDGDAGRAWVTLNGTDELALVDLGQRSVVRYVPTGQRPHDILLGPQRLWVTDWGGPVHVFEADGEHVRTLQVGREAHHLTFTPDGTEAWITDHGANIVAVVSTESLEIVARMEVPGGPHHVAVTADGRWTVVADDAGGRAVIFDAREKQEVGSVSVGAQPHGVWTAA